MGWKNYLRRRKTETIELEKVEVSWLGITGRWVADRRQQTAAWEMYVELITRIATQPLAAEEGSLREALSSLHQLFGETRDILRRHGPGVARPITGSDVSFAGLAVAVLNKVLRPLLSKWHPRLQSHESQRPNNLSPSDHERSWTHEQHLRTEIEMARKQLKEYAGLLAQASGVPNLVDSDTAGTNRQVGSRTRGAAE